MAKCTVVRVQGPFFPLRVQGTAHAHCLVQDCTETSLLPRCRAVFTQSGGRCVDVMSGPRAKHFLGVHAVCTLQASRSASVTHSGGCKGWLQGALPV